MPPRLSSARVQSFVSAYCSSYPASSTSSSRLYTTCLQPRRQHPHVHLRRLLLSSSLPSYRAGKKVRRLPYPHMVLWLNRGGTACVSRFLYELGAPGSVQGAWSKQGCQSRGNQESLLLGKYHSAPSSISLILIVMPSSRGSTIPTRTRIRTRRRSSSRYRKHMMCVIGVSIPSL